MEEDGCANDPDDDVESEVELVAESAPHAESEKNSDAETGSERVPSSSSESERHEEQTLRQRRPVVSVTPERGSCIYEVADLTLLQPKTVRLPKRLQVRDLRCLGSTESFVSIDLKAKQSSPARS
jgi:hypothetical protein